MRAIMIDGCAYGEACTRFDHSISAFVLHSMKTSLMAVFRYETRGVDLPESSLFQLACNYRSLSSCITDDYYNVTYTVYLPLVER